jgi:glutathione S-transferase
MLVVHHLGVSQSERIVWLCEELGIPYELKVYPRDPETRLAPAAYKALHPMGIAPVITDGDVTLAESGAIMEYILARYGNGRLVPKPDAPEFPEYLFWFHFANGTQMPSEMAAWVASSVGGAESPLAAVMNERVERAYKLLEDRLSKSPYLAGQELTAADIITVFGLTTMRAFTGRSIAGYPAILAYLKRIGERPAYKRAMAKGDPDMPPMLS